MDDDRIDFSALDPKRDARRFERMVGTVVARARLTALSPLSLGYQLIVWGRTAVAVSALAALTAWLPTLVRSSSNSGQSALGPGSDPVELLSSWARTDKVPADEDPDEALAELYGG